ncbi:hypothetical protein [Alistipes onderdonkii]|uniref:hypothetical protein n=1 Tax=Alistipes onderdonkii TaxID=328813 RepID=UPI00187480D4|nr:hypothetical protein [Alistipes onderdonkii]MBE5048015.1 hypothetical protein [Alistipes onderdonkii]
MREFDLEAAKAGAAVCTKDGAKVRIICFDRISTKFPIIGLRRNTDNEEYVVTFTTNGRRFYTSKDGGDLVMRDDDYAEKLARGEYGKHIDEATEKVDPVVKENLTVGREYWRRVYAGQMMAAAFPVFVSTDWQAKGEFANIPTESLIARQAIALADALLEELEKTEKKL